MKLVYMIFNNQYVIYFYICNFRVLPYMNTEQKRWKHWYWELHASFTYHADLLVHSHI